MTTREVCGLAILLAALSACVQERGDAADDALEDVAAETVADTSSDAPSDATPDIAPDTVVDTPTPDAADLADTAVDAPPADADVPTCDPAACPAPADGCLEAACVAGACAEVAIDCDDGDSCTLDFCLSGQCQHEVRNTWFADSDPGFGFTPEMLLAPPALYVALPDYNSVTGDIGVTLRSRKDIDAATSLNWEVAVQVEMTQTRVLAMRLLGGNVVVAGVGNSNEVWLRTVTPGGVVAGPALDVFAPAGVLPLVGLIRQDGVLYLAGVDGDDAWAAGYDAVSGNLTFSHTWVGSNAWPTAMTVYENDLLIADDGPQLRRISTSGVPGADVVSVAVTSGLVGRIESLVPLPGADGGLMAVGFARQPGDLAFFPQTGQGWIVRFNKNLGVVTNGFTEPPSPSLSVKLQQAVVIGTGEEPLIAIAGTADIAEVSPEPVVFDEEPLFAIADVYGRVRHQRIYGSAGQRQLFERIIAHSEGGFIVAGADDYGANGKTAVRRIGAWGSLSCDPLDPCAASGACATDGEPCTQESCQPDDGCTQPLLATGEACGSAGQSCSLGACSD